MIYLMAALIPAIIAVSPIFGSRFIPTHDGEYHIIRFWQFYTSLVSGDWFPRWAPDLNNGLGIPLFTFQYPFPNYVGSIFHQFGLSYVDSVKWTLGFGYLVALIFCYLWVRHIFGRIPGVIATIVCSYIPYWFVDIYIRGSVGEVWAIAWVFAALYAISTKRRLFIALMCAFLVISHNIMALIFIPILLIYAYIRDRSCVVHIVLGVGIASYFWIPALYEQRFIVGISQVSVFDYFPRIDQLFIPSWGSGFRGQITGGNEMSYQVGIVPTFLLIFLGVKMIQKRKIFEKKETSFAFFCALAAVLFMMPWSMPLWRLLPLVHFVQYPWRLLSVVIVMTPVLAGYVVTKYRFGWVIAIAAVLVSYGYSRPVTYEPRVDSHYLLQESFAKGTSSMGNAFQTKWLRSIQDSSTIGFSLTNGTLHVTKKKSTQYEVDILATASGTLVAPIAYYPGWFMKTPNGIVKGDIHSQGLLTFPVHEGHYNGILYLGLTLWQKVAVCISILSLLVAVVSFILKK